MNQKEDLYVIGFPKSGNTWLSRMLAEYTNSNINVTSKKNKLDSTENSKYRKGKYLIHKIHYTYELDRVKSAKKVYIVRDVRDSIVSGFFHNYRQYTEDEIKNSKLLTKLFNYEAQGINKKWQGSISARIKAKTYLALKTFILRREKVNIGNWSDHVKYWTSFDNMVIARYEDLLENTEVEFNRVVTELGLNIKQESIKKVIDNQSFEKKKNAFLEKGDIQNAKFLRSGKKESWRNLIDKNLQHIIETEHKEVMKLLGYEVETV